jgi:hypothetical protein
MRCLGQNENTEVTSMLGINLHENKSPLCIVKKDYVTHFALESILKVFYVSSGTTLRTAILSDHRN